VLSCCGSNASKLQNFLTLFDFKFRICLQFVHVETFKKFIRRLATEISDANDIPYCIALSYWQRRMPTTLQRMNATILRSTQVKISRRLGMMREVDLDPNDHTFNDRHTSLHDMTA
jgi:hypothetical protein